MDKVVRILRTFQSTQTDLMKQMSEEKCDDIHSVLRAKDLASSIIELQIRIELLKDLIIEN